MCYTVDTVVSQYTFIGYVFSLILVDVYTCYREVHVLYGGHSGVAVYTYRIRLWIYANNKSTCVYVIAIYMCYTVDTAVSQYTCIG